MKCDRGNSTQGTIQRRSVAVLGVLLLTIGGLSFAGAGISAAATPDSDFVTVTVNGPTHFVATGLVRDKDLKIDTGAGATVRYLRDSWRLKDAQGQIVDVSALWEGGRYLSIDVKRGRQLIQALSRTAPSRHKTTITLSRATQQMGSHTYSVSASVIRHYVAKKPVIKPVPVGTPGPSTGPSTVEIGPLPVSTASAVPTQQQQNVGTTTQTQYAGRLTPAKNANMVDSSSDVHTLTCPDGDSGCRVLVAQSPTQYGTFDSLMTVNNHGCGGFIFGGDQTGSSYNYAAYCNPGDGSNHITMQRVGNNAGCTLDLGSISDGRWNGSASADWKLSLQKNSVSIDVTQGGVSMFHRVLDLTDTSVSCQPQAGPYVGFVAIRGNEANETAIFQTPYFYGSN